MYHNFADFFQNCWKALATRTLISVTKQYKAKNIREVVL